MNTFRRPRFLILLVMGFSICSLQSAEIKVKKVRLGQTVNSPAGESGALISADGQTLYFNREFYVDDDVRKLMKDQMLGGMDEKTINDMKGLDEATRAELLKSMKQTMSDDKLRALTHTTIWCSERQPDGSWGPAKKMPSPLNNKFASYVCTVLPDGNTLLAGGIFDDRLTSAASMWQTSQSGVQKIWAVVVRSGDTWGAPKYLRIAGLPNLVKSFPLIMAAGNQVLVMAMGSEESIGQKDLFVSFLQKDGTWSNPKNLGPTVNGPKCETNPFVAPDGVSLYFSSNRPGGYGDYDIYFTRRLDDSWLKWSPPRNVGPDANDGEGQMDLSTDASGNYAFLTQGQGRQADIFAFMLPEDVRPIPTAIVRGRAHDPANNSVPATIGYERLRDGTGAGQANANQSTGNYRIGLPVGENYGFRAEAKGYIAVSETIDLTKAKPGEEFKRDLLLIPVKVGAAIRLNNVFFEFAKSNLLPESKVELERLVAILTQFPKMEIEVAGHTDNVGDAASNQKLSEDRAAAVKQYLLDHGVAGSRLRSKGYGKSMPVAPNDTDEHRQLNRRVEFTILKME